MKISIYNFKSIDSLVEYELKLLNILSGINSTGKSSFIQLLLLLKETLNIDSSKYQLVLDGDLFKVNEYLDIINEKKLEKKLKVVFEIPKKEFQKYGDRVKPSFYDSFPDYTCRIEITYDFDQKSDVIYVSDFLLNYNVPIANKTDQYIRIEQVLNSKAEFKIDSNVDIFGKNIWNNNPVVVGINYSSIFPLSYDIYKKEIVPGTKKGEEIINEENFTTYTDIASIKTFLDEFFKEIHYVGPLREQPKDFYSQKRNIQTVGANGENTAQVLKIYKDEPIELFVPIFTENGISYQLKKTTLIEGVKIWMCDIFKVGKDIYSKKVGDSYIIYLVNFGGIETTIKHVGFGISQILPIVVEGLRMKRNATLILEQPEIHLHPKIQSLLFDFLYSLNLLEKMIILETHSDHLITRMRRRIAEDNDNKLGALINLTFIESTKGNVLFKNIPLDDYGTSDFFPDDFIEKSDVELRAIVMAQMRKKMNTEKKV